MMGRSIMMLLTLCINAAFTQFNWPPAPCPGDSTKTCMAGFRCKEFNGKTNCVRSPNKIAFQAHMTGSQGHYPDGTVLIYPDVALNDGQSYYPTVGTFKAPVGGVYHFTVHFCSQPNKQMTVAIFNGETQITATTVFEEPFSSCTSHSVIASVAKGEMVLVKALGTDSYLQADAHRWPSFNGFLMYTY